MTTIATLQTNDLTVARGPQLVLDAVNITVAPGHRVGLIGPNGVGKSTLLKAIAGMIPLEKGSVRRLPQAAAVGYLPQEPERNAGETARAFLERRTGVADADRELQEATNDLALGTNEANDRYGAALDTWMALGGADLDTRIGQVWHELNLATGLLEQPMPSLSGGEAARCNLAGLLLSRFDIYLLDEPTNDLDLDGLDRLETWITSLSGGVLLVSHDRAFLSRTITDVAEIDEFTHRLAWYSGGWDSFMEQRDTSRRHAWEKFDDYDSKRKDLARRSQREREWASQGVSKAKRDSTEKDKNIRAFKVNSSEQLAGKAARTDKAIERLEAVDKPRDSWQLKMTIAAVGRSGDMVVRLVGAKVDRSNGNDGGFVLGPINLEISYGERVAVVGANGAGKTTLLNTMLGRHELIAGQRWFGSGVVLGEVEQARSQLSSDATLVRAFSDATSLLPVDARTLMAKFGLGADHVERPASSLSPGERTRAAMALLMANGANLLVLDEPTNHLDLPAIEQLEQALETFHGTVLLVTHDRALLNEVRLTRTICMQSGRVVADDPV